MSGDQHEPSAEITKGANNIERCTAPNKRPAREHKTASNRRGGLPPRYEPSEAEIAEACAAIRRGWTEAERLRRGRLLDQ